MNLPIKLRSPTPTDLPFILSTWTESYEDSKYNPIYGPAYQFYFRLLLNKLIPKCLITVLCNPEDNWQIYGYAIYQIKDDNLILHWIYIKYIYRHLGLANYIFNTLLDMVPNKKVIITLKPCYYNKYKDSYDHSYKPKLAFE